MIDLQTVYSVVVGISLFKIGAALLYIFLKIFAAITGIMIGAVLSDSKKRR